MPDYVDRYLVKFYPLGANSYLILVFCFFKGGWKQANTCFVVLSLPSRYLYDSGVMTDIR